MVDCWLLVALCVDSDVRRAVRRDRVDDSVELRHCLLCLLQQRERLANELITEEEKKKRQLEKRRLKKKVINYWILK